MGLGIIWSLLTSRLGGWIIGGLAVAAALMFLNWEHNAKLRARAAQATAEQGLQIGYEGYVKLYQERDKIKAQANNQRRKLSELQQTNDLDGLADTFNNPGGVRRPLHANSPGGLKAPAAYYDPDSPGAKYQEAP